MSLKETAEKELGIPIRIKAGAPGSFKVLVNGEQVYSKSQTGRMPTSAEFVNLLRQHTVKV